MKASYLWVATALVLVACQHANDSQTSSGPAVPLELSRDITLLAQKSKSASEELKAQLKLLFQPVRQKVPVLGLILNGEKAAQKYQREFANLDQEGRTALTRMKQTCLPELIRDKQGDNTVKSTLSLKNIDGGHCEIDFIEKALTTKQVRASKFEIQSGTSESKVETNYKLTSTFLTGKSPLIGYKQTSNIASTFEDFQERDRSLIQGSLHQVTKTEGTLILKDGREIAYSAILESITRVNEERRQLVTTFHFPEGDITAALIKNNNEEKAYLDGSEISPDTLFSNYGLTFSK